MNAALELHSSSNRLDRARKLRQEPVPGVLHDAAAVLDDCWINGVRQERGQFGMRSLFVIVHEPRVASHVGGHYRRQPALDPVWWLLRHGTQLQPIGYCMSDQTTVPCDVPSYDQLT